MIIIMAVIILFHLHEHNLESLFQVGQQHLSIVSLLLLNCWGNCKIFRFHWAPNCRSIRRRSNAFLSEINPFLLSFLSITFRWEPAIELNWAGFRFRMTVASRGRLKRWFARVRIGNLTAIVSLFLLYIITLVYYGSTDSINLSYHTIC